MVLRWGGAIPFDEAYWIREPFNFEIQQGATGTHDLYLITLPVLSSPDVAFGRALYRLWRYEIFPKTRMIARVCTADGAVASGATIVQRIRLGPFALEMAVRVVDVFEY